MRRKKERKDALSKKRRPEDTGYEHIHKRNIVNLVKDRILRIPAGTEKNDP